MGRGTFKRIIQGKTAEKKDAPQQCVMEGAAKPWEKEDIVNATLKTEGVDAAEGSAASSLPKDDQQVEAATELEGDSPTTGTSEHPTKGAENGTATSNTGSARPTAQNTGTSGDGVERHASDIEKTAVYGDVDVCRILKIHRRVLATARTKQTRGIDWDCVGMHAGMTMSWIQSFGLARGIVPDFLAAPLKPIEDGDGVVSVKLKGVWPNLSRVTVEVVATGQMAIATVRDSRDFHLNEIFDCRAVGKELIWDAALNDARY